MKKYTITNPSQFKKAMKKIALYAVSVTTLLLFLIYIALPVMEDQPLTPEGAKEAVSYDNLFADNEKQPIAVQVKGVKDLVYVVKMEDSSIRIAYVESGSDYNPYRAREFNPSQSTDVEKYGAAVDVLTK